MIDGGVMKAHWESWTRLRRDLSSAERYSGIDAQFGVGWNMISYTYNGLKFTFRASKNFQTFSSNSVSQFLYTEGFTGILGGFLSGKLLIAF